ncbi:hypothetical protein [Ensifer aridi]
MIGKLKDIDPQAWLADVLARISDTTVLKLVQWRPWMWAPTMREAQAA